MKKFIQLSAFVSIHQFQWLTTFSALTKGEISRSRMVREALTQYRQAIEELDDAAKAATKEGRAALDRETKNIERALKAER